MKNNYLAIGFSLLLFSTLLIIRKLDIQFVEYDKITAVTFIAFGSVTLATAFHKINRGIIFISTAILLTGIILLTLNSFEVLNKFDALLGSILFVVGGGILALFIDNTKETVLLYLSLFLFAGSIIAVIFGQSNPILIYANRVAIVLYDLWPILLIFFGIIFFAGRRK